MKDGFFVAPDDGLERRSDLQAGDPYYASSVDNNNPADTSTRGSPELGKFYERAEVGTTINAQLWRNVNYLSHDWKEEEILSSWKYITTRRGEDPNSARLENACWRTWTKYKNNLKTMSPETLNWLKDSDEDYPEEKEHIRYHTAEAIVNIILPRAGNPSGPGEAERQPAIKRAFL
uniref:Nitrogen regulatory protein areA GATA-like domain-containing protein n=1 Tax=Fusarium oxysporum (strain Fo5176) TaxID=660025 RepID=A0A0D2YJL9_FUSOF